jgi:hypothetical protein
VTIVSANTQTLIASGLNPSTYGEPVTFEAVVTNLDTIPAPVGTVEFIVGNGTHVFNVPLTSMTVPTGGITFDGDPLPAGTLYGLATLTVAGEPQGLYGGDPSVTADYLGSTTGFNASTDSLPEEVDPRLTSTATSGGTFVFGQPITLTASLDIDTSKPFATSVPLPAGAINFTFNGSGLTFTGSPLTPSGLGEISTLGPPFSAGVGTFPYTASYGGQLNSLGGPSFDYAPSSATGTLVVLPGGTSVVLTSSADPSASGQSVTFTASLSVVAPAQGTPTGTLTIEDSSGHVIAQTTVGSGTTSVSGADPNLPIGADAITAIYSGDGNFAASSTTISQDVEL